jgi:hypothetical protein
MKYEIDLHPEPLSKNGKQSVVLPHAEFEAIQEELDQLEDLRALREAKATDANAPGLSLSEVKQRYGIKQLFARLQNARRPAPPSTSHP